MAAPATKRVRRSTEEIRWRLLEAARELFSANGYDATYTKHIAAKAGVAEKVLFGNFGTKAAIFDAAFTEPFAQLADRYVAAWNDDTSAPVENRISDLVAGLCDLAYRNRVMLRAALARQGAGGADPQSEIVDHIARAIHSMMRIEQNALPTVDQEAALIAVAGMVFGVTLLDDMLIPPGQRRPGRKRLENEMTALILHGVLRN